MSEKLMLGVSRRDITPEVGGNLMGYNPHIYSEKINDNLTATAFVFQYGDTKAAMISVTLCVISEAICDMLRTKICKNCGIPFENIMISAIHTHSGPITTDMVGWGDADKKYCDEIFFPVLLDAVNEANANLVEVEMGFATGDSFVGCNRRELNKDNEIVLGQCPWGPFNPKMTVISFRDSEKKVIANMVHYGCHATAAGSNHEVSRDWPGVMTDILEKESSAITAFFNGPEGDVGPRLSNGCTTGNGDISYAMEIGAVAGYDAVNIYRKISHYCDVALTTSQRKLQMKLASRIPYEYAKEQYEIFKNEKVNHLAQSRDYYEKVLASYDNGYVEEEYKEVPQVAIRIGDIAFAGFGYELFSEIGMRIDKMSSIGHVLSLIDTNGAWGYFPTEDQLCRGGYEIKMFKTRNLQPFAPNADFNLITETLKNLEQL